LEKIPRRSQQLREKGKEVGNFSNREHNEEKMSE
jgi:hypothetical protein